MCPLRGYARLVGAPNYTPSLCSVAGLLLALALKAAARTHRLSNIDLSIQACAKGISVLEARGETRPRAERSPRASRACSCRSMQERRCVLVGSASRSKRPRALLPAQRAARA